MTCEEFERVLPELGSGSSIEQEAHLRLCPACSELVADLNAIAQQARYLKASRNQARGYGILLKLHCGKKA